MEHWYMRSSGSSSAEIKQTEESFGGYNFSGKNIGNPHCGYAMGIYNRYINLIQETGYDPGQHLNDTSYQEGWTSLFYPHEINNLESRREPHDKATRRNGPENLTRTDVLL